MCKRERGDSGGKDLRRRMSWMQIEQKRGFVERSNRMRFNVPWGAEGMCEIHCGYKEATCYLGEATWVVLRLPVWFDEVTLIEVYLFSVVV